MQLRLLDEFGCLIFFSFFSGHFLELRGSMPRGGVAVCVFRSSSSISTSFIFEIPLWLALEWRPVIYILPPNSSCYSFTTFCPGKQFDGVLNPLTPACNQICLSELAEQFRFLSPLCIPFALFVAF
jgi:hypothetical protein